MVVLSHEIRHVSERSDTNPINYILGGGAGQGESMQGHHAENTLLIIEEASGVEDIVYDMGTPWAKHILGIGNPLPCTNFFFRAVKGGDIRRDSV